MADNFGVLGTNTALIVGTATVYTCPASRSAKVKIFAMFQGAATTDIGIVVNNIEVARTGAIGANNYVYTNGGAGLLVAPAAAKPIGTAAATTVQPSAPIYYLSAGQTIQYTVNTAAALAANMQVVGIEVDLTA